MNKKIFELRLVKSSDWAPLLEWRNDIVTLKNSFNSIPIEKSEHIEYLKESIKNSDTNIFMLLFNETPVGTVRKKL